MYFEHVAAPSLKEEKKANMYFKHKFFDVCHNIDTGDPYLSRKATQPAGMRLPERLFKIYSLLDSISKTEKHEGVWEPF
jgi:hypothetical protein